MTGQLLEICHFIQLHGLDFIVLQFLLLGQVLVQPITIKYWLKCLCQAQGCRKITRSWKRIKRYGKQLMKQVIGGAHQAPNKKMHKSMYDIYKATKGPQTKRRQVEQICFHFFLTGRKPFVIVSVTFAEIFLYVSQASLIHHYTVLGC